MTEIRAHCRKELLDVKLLDLVVHVDIVLVEDLGVVEWFENGLLEGVGEVGELVGGFEAADEGLKAFLLAKVPVEEAEVRVRKRDGAGDVDCLDLRTDRLASEWVSKAEVGEGSTNFVERELDALDEVEGDCIL